MHRSQRVEQKRIEIYVKIRLLPIEEREEELATNSPSPIISVHQTDKITEQKNNRGSASFYSNRKDIAAPLPSTRDPPVRHEANGL